MTKADIDRARSVYLKTRSIWFADSVMDAHERLSLITVASGLRKFSFFTHARAPAQKQIRQLTAEMCLNAKPLNLRFDLRLRTVGVDADCEAAYVGYHRRYRRFQGIGVWPGGDVLPSGNITICSLGELLGYPRCCVEMDVDTKIKDHSLFLEGLVAEVGNDASQVVWGLRRKCYVRKSSESHLQRWRKRYEMTCARFPFALHAACDNCLSSAASPTGEQSDQYQELATAVSEELAFLVRWAARIISGGRR